MSPPVAAIPMKSGSVSSPTSRPIALIWTGVSAASDDQVAGSRAEVQRDAVRIRAEGHHQGEGERIPRRRERAGSRIRCELRRVNGPAVRDARLVGRGSLARERNGRRALVRRGETRCTGLGLEVPPDRGHEAGGVRICGKNRSCKQHSSHRAKRPGCVSMTILHFYTPLLIGHYPTNMC